jgi:hypothetical protein
VVLDREDHKARGVLLEHGLVGVVGVLLGRHGEDAERCAHAGHATTAGLARDAGTSAHGNGADRQAE